MTNYFVRKHKKKSAPAVVNPLKSETIKSPIQLKVLNESFVPDERKADIRKSLRRVRGQIEALERFLDERRPCSEFLMQTAAAQEGLRRVSRLMLQNYLERCATMAIREGRPEIYDEFTKLMYKLIR